MRHIRPDIHEVGNAVATLTLSIAFEKFANLEEQHDEDGLRELSLGTREEADAEGADGGHRHEEMFVEHVALGNTFPCLMQRVVTYQKVWNQIYQQ